MIPKGQIIQVGQGKITGVEPYFLEPRIQSPHPSTRDIEKIRNLEHSAHLIVIFIEFAGMTGDTQAGNVLYRNPRVRLF